VSIGGDLLDCGARMVSEPQVGLKNKCEEILMNWKTLLVITSLTLSAGLTACNKEAATPDATKPADTTAPAAETKPGETKTETKTTETKPADGMKAGDKPADGMKPGATKTETKTTETKPAATKKP
jgi:septal ring-binding cell division protein DamX